MEVNVNKLRQSLHWLREHVQSKESLSADDKRVLQKFEQLEKYEEADIQRILQWLSEHLMDAAYTEQIAVNFEEFLLLILSKCLNCDDTKNFAVYQKKCIALAQLQRLSVEARRYATNYFRAKPAPFKNLATANEAPPNKRSKTDQIDNLALLKCCFQLLSSDASFYKDLWNWSPLVDTFINGDTQLNSLEQLYFNHILAILSNMSLKKLGQLNANIPATVVLEFEKDQNSFPKAFDYQEDVENSQIVNFNFQSNAVTNIEGVLLPIFNKQNYDFYAQSDGAYENIVKVDSTRVNLRSLALGIANSKTICLSGPVGCGKTTLVEYLARKTGRVCPKANEMETEKDILMEKSLNELLNLETNNTNGFLRIQLGDQTDSKMLLGQYRCTDVPGEFVWLPGILTQAVMCGYWLLLEDLDSATQDTYTILSGLLENKYLSVPGFRDCVKIQAGFQLFVTVRTNKSANNSSQKALFSLLEKYIYTINILPLSRNELCKVVSTNYPKLSTVANRIVDVFLTFSSGDHAVADHLRRQETGDKADNTENFVALPFEAVSLASIPNAGRLVSTRDLVKLCQRSNPVFSVTSTECAYFVFQNAVDVFCSNLPQGKEKTKLIVSIGAKLGIIQSRCETFANDYKPEVQLDKDRIKVGRAELYTKGNSSYGKAAMENEDDFLISKKVKRQKLSTETEKSLVPLASVGKRVTFSFTRLASCLLERIAVCVAHAEPVLLVGETGVGKTSSVQYLAERTAHKLVVVNMNNQSDVSDLVGGFKPVDLSYVLAPLRQEFEMLFCDTYDPVKNSIFLSKLGSCYNQNIFTALVKMMIKIANGVLTKPDELPAEVIELLPRWKSLKVKLLKLDSQLSKSINISFAFIPGSLVNCIKNGDWVLLDEINLASAETLECLSTILEPDGSIVLLEKGDFTPVRRHADFRIFACMNPNTDIGKKDLPVGIRNRFTEFFVDELTTDSDLSLLVSDYLQNTGIQRKCVTNIVKLYKKLRQLAKLELNDGLGNRPVYSLRTLCRALIICAKNLCGSIERNLYESFCLSFLTQLDPTSHGIVLNLIKAALVSNEKAVLRQAIPKPGENYLDFEGYWIQQGPKSLQECSNYILTESVKANLKDLSRIISIGKLPILLQGPTSAGKTSLIEYVAKRSGNHCLRINNHEHTDLQEYIGTYVADVTGKLSFSEGVLVQAMRNGYWIILDELNLASTEILEALNRVLDDNRELYIPETQTVVKAHPNFMLFATQNPPGLYGGRKTLSRAFKNRFIELHFSDIPRPELEIILERRCLIPPSYAKKMVMCMSDLQKNRKTTSKNVFTLRDLFRWGNRYTFADKKLLEDKKYDWNQHLVEEGYLVLSAKVRTTLEIEIIEDALYRNFKKRIELSHLFDVLAPVEQISPVTTDILDAIKAYKERLDIVWTRNMTRMAVLTAKALQFDEPVLLVGPTGCGKTTVCQLLAGIKNVQLRILNCHMHTEGADFLGGLRPCRQSNTDKDNEGRSTRNKLFEWTDGPLIHAMLEGSYFMADEISLAEDSVLERLNCILEPERTVLLAEKGGIVDTSTDQDENIIASDFVVQAKEGFQFLATMNPGGDFGKKELSPALRNRFTEIWCLPSDAKEDLIQIASNCMCKELNQQDSRKIASYLVEVVLYMRDNVEKFKFSVRDILAWAHYMVSNAHLSFAERAIFGLETIFLDALEMLPHESIKQIDELRKKITLYAIGTAFSLLGEKFTFLELESKRGQTVICENNFFGLKPFLVPINPIECKNLNKDFTFKAPTTKKNLFRLLSALSLQKPILLEGPPGVGKTSTVESLAKAIGYNIVRINLCEHTDLADLFGTDLPAEDNIFNGTTENGESQNFTNNSTQIGSFVWRDGPLLSALKADLTWILLDELNLAPQSVLEGLNAILDHRGEVFIPELNKTFILNKSTRIFACQNPLKQGGGRKGLPQSFLNRFNKVFLRKLTTEDLLFVVNEKYGKSFQQLQQQLVDPLIKEQIVVSNIFDLRHQIEQSDWLSTNNSVDTENINNLAFDVTTRLVKFSEALDHGVAQMEFAYRGGPYEFNLRDILRWCDFLIDHQTGVHIKQYETMTATETFVKNFDSFMQTLYDTMKLVYMQRMRTTQDQEYIQNVFGRVFNCDAARLNNISKDISLYWTDEHLYLSDLILERDASTTAAQQQLRAYSNKELSPLLLASQREYLQNIVACVQHQKPVLLCGSTDTGKTKLIDALCTLSNQVVNTDNIDDTVTGSFQQIDLNRHLEELALGLEYTFWIYIQELLLQRKGKSVVTTLLDNWYEYTTIGRSYNLVQAKNSSFTMSKELIIFRKRIEHLQHFTQQLMQAPQIDVDSLKYLKRLQTLLDLLSHHTRNAESLNMGGSFEWVDSKIVKSLKYGQYIALEHVNLCSSAVLDRLNPIFEPNGNLLISEKGVSTTDVAEIVEKSPNFRAFLTIDPKNGELSRAMRNRCVELALQKDAYSVDDMRQIIHANGVRDILAINCILQMHTSIKELTEINNYNISHLNQCAFLVTSYKRIGYATSRAIYVSGMEVYVYAANMDLLGYGLTYYQNKLRDIVMQHMQSYIESLRTNEIQTSEDFLAPLMLHTGLLNQVTMIKSQMTPFKLLLKAANPKSMSAVRAELSLYLNDFENCENILKTDSMTLIRLYVYMLYQSSSFADLELRHIHLREMLSTHTSNAALQKLATQLFDSVQSVQCKFPPNLQRVPWHDKMYERMRVYTTAEFNPHIYRLSSLLIARLLMVSIPPENLTNLKNISVLDYSRALLKKLVTEKSNNTFIKLISKLFMLLESIIVDKINIASINVIEFVELSTKLLWFNRLLCLAQSHFFVGKEIDRNLIDKLMLHYEWLCKHLLRFLAKIANETNYQEFDDMLQKLGDYIASVKPKLNRLRKHFVKNVLAIQPYYSEQQIYLQSLGQQLDELLNVVPNYGCFSHEYIQRKFIAQKTNNATKARSLLNSVKEVGIVAPCLKSVETEVPEAIRSSLKNYSDEFFDKFINKDRDNDDIAVHIEELKAEIEVLHGKINSQDEFSDSQRPNEIELGLLPIREYFLTKALVQRVATISNSIVDNAQFNEIYCEELPAMNTETWQLVRLYSDSSYESLLRLVKDLMGYVEGLKNTENVNFGGLVKNLNGSYKELNAVWRTLYFKCYKQQLSTLATHFSCTQIVGRGIEEISAASTYEGPALVNACLSLLFQADGALKPVALKDLDTWKQVLRQMRQLIWQNSLVSIPKFNQLEQNFEMANKHASKLLTELEFNGLEDADADYLKLITSLNAVVEEAAELKHKNFSHLALKYQAVQYQTSIMNAFIGAIELSTLVSTPLIDPVEKQRLKKLYLEEDISCLHSFTTIYDVMRIVTKYKHFGDEIYIELGKQREILESKQKRQNQNVALRPSQCLYAKLVQDLQHFLNTNCAPGSLFKLLTLAQTVWSKLSTDFVATEAQSAVEFCCETISKLSLWLANAQRFIYHVLKPYAGYYEDFLQPLKLATQQFGFGLEGLKTVFSQLANSISQESNSVFINLNQNAHVQRIVGNFAEFPNTRVLKTTTKNLPATLNSNAERLRMLQIKLDALSKHIHIVKHFNNEAFEYLNSALAEYNEIWQLEEEQLRLRKAADESIYVHKTKCEDEDEELVELEEIESYFPTHVDEDYGEYLNADSLEQKQIKKPKLQQKPVSLLDEEKTSVMAQHFMELLDQYSHVCYHQPSTNVHAATSLDFISTSKDRLRAFAALYARHKLCLNDWMDEQAYNALCFAITIQENLLSELPNASPIRGKQQQHQQNKQKVYNFYKHSNIPEIIACSELLERIRALVQIQLDLYPEHATLLDIQQIIGRVCQLSSNAPLVRFSTGFQLLRQKVAQWNEVAHKHNHLRNEEIELAEYVQKWMRLELQCWRNCLDQTQSQTEKRAFRYWFYVYNLLQQYLGGTETLDSSYTDMKYAEKRFGDGEILDATDVAQQTKISDHEVMRILKQFIEASNYGDFHVRLRLLQSFELYLQCCHKEQGCGREVNEKLIKIIAGLRNLQIYFAQFSQEISDAKQTMRTPIEKKLKEFVKIESYNKDLSYFSMRNNVARVHRNINKFLKEYRLKLEQKITPVFQPQDATVGDYNFENIKGKALRYDAKVKYNLLIDVKNFMASPKLRSDNPNQASTEQSSVLLLAQVGKHFSTSRNVVKSTIQNATYPQMIMALDELLSALLERCDYLRNLNVDRTKERPKQVLEAKQILQQKRKGLTDLFKQLTQLGISYKSGLMEQAIRTDFEDIALQPFCVRNMICANTAVKDKNLIYGHMLQLNENLDRYYAKSVFKLKLLRNIMLSPLSELGPPNIERIKGFAISLFLFVQNQRRLLAETTCESFKLKNCLRSLHSIAELATSPEQLNFASHRAAFECIKRSTSHMRFVLEQFKLLLECVPDRAVKTEQVFICSSGVLTKDTEQYEQLAKICDTTLDKVKVILEKITQADVEFLSLELLRSYENQHEELVKQIASMKALCRIPNEEQCLPLAKPLEELLNYTEYTKNLKNIKTSPEDKNEIDFENSDNELSILVHDILISLQKLYKDHVKLVTDEDVTNIQKSSPKKKDEDENELEDHHLKTLHGALETDWVNLKIAQLLQKLEPTLENLKSTPGSPSKLLYVRKLCAILPLLEQYYLMAEYQLLQQLGAHKVTAKMLSIMLTVFVEIGTKGFCVPPDLMQDEQGERKKDQKEGEGFGLEDGTGEKDASDKIESEDQLDDAKRPEDRKDQNDENKQEDCKEEKGIEMSDDFDGKMQDIEKPEDEEDDSGESEDEDDLNKEMGETEEGAEKLDDQIWGDDEEPEPEPEDKDMNEEDGKGTKDEKDAHNDLDTKNDAADNKNEQEEEGLDATDETPEQDKRKKEKPDIDDMKDPEVNEDQDNPYHNELEEPPEPEEMDLGDMNNNEDENDGENEEGENDNPFDIDSMKQNMPDAKDQTEEDNEEKNEDEADKQEDEADDSDDDEGEDNLKHDKNEENPPEMEDEAENENDNEEPETQKRGDAEEDKTADEENENNAEKQEEKPEEHAPSQDKSSKEENMQSMPNTDDKASADQASKEEDDTNVKQDQKLDEQDTGEEKDGVGQAENEENDGGHKGIADTKDSVSKEESKKEQKTKEKRKQGHTNEERSLGEAEKNKLKQLKTIDKLKEEKENQNQDPDPENADDTEQDAEEYQHVKEPKSSDKTTLDNATEEQSKKIQHQEDENKEDNNEDATETNDDLMDVDEEETINEDTENLEEITAERNEKKSEKSSKSEKTKDPNAEQEQVEIEGEIVQTMTVARGDDTTAHMNKDIILDSSTQADELSASELLEMRKMYQQQLGQKSELPQHEHYETWQIISNRMSQNARELCEQLRLILEPTKCTRLKGDYRTGRRINMKKIIPYIASQFRKDKIWLRRTKPAQRDYKITIAIDDSKSMHHNNSKMLTLEAISLVSQALTLLESGRLSVVSFGEAPKIILNHTEQFDGPKLVNALNFAQDKTKIAELLDFIRTVNTEEGAFGSDNGLFENLLLVLSDGRNIFSEGKTKVKNAIKLARLQRIFLVYIIIDNPENKSSILDIQTMEMLPDSRINIKSYLDEFPFPYYVIVRDLNQLPLVLSEAMRQWFELVNSEQ